MTIPFGRAWTGLPASERLSNADMAQALREGIPPTEVAAAAGISVWHMRDTLTDAGWSGKTGQRLGVQPVRLRPPEPASDLSWQDRAICVGADPEIFFPDRGKPTDEARRICGNCPVQRECDGRAFATGEHGIWGASSRYQRTARKSGTNVGVSRGMRAQVGVQPERIGDKRNGPGSEPKAIPDAPSGRNLNMQSNPDQSSAPGTCRGVA